MTWDEYYEKTNDWSVSTSVKKMSALENLGPSNEIADVIIIIGYEDKKGATRLLNKAIQGGVKFSGEELVDIWENCDYESTCKALDISADKFTPKDLEDLFECIDDELIINIVKKYKLSIPECIADEYEEALCSDTTAPIRWSEFYDKFWHWDEDYAIKRSKNLIDFGNEDEVLEVINELYMTDESGAGEFISKAIEHGVKFNADNIYELTFLCNEQIVELAAQKSGIPLNQDDLEQYEENNEEETEEETEINTHFEIVNAINSADFALQCLYQALDALNTGSRTSFWDMMNPDVFTHTIKYTALNEAEQEVINAQNALQNLNYSLRNLLNCKDVRIKFVKLASVADMLSDSNFINGIVQSQINKTRKRIAKAIKQVRLIRGELETIIQKSKGSIGR